MSPVPRRQRVETVPFERPKQLGVGSLIAGKYLLESVIGDGACGVVYRAKQLALDKTVAIKVLHRAMSEDDAVVERFHREARAASQLSHPGSIAVFDFGQEPGRVLYLVMDYVEGRDLYALMGEEPQLPPQRIVSILSQILGALSVAHDRGIVHRDLKPENILVASARNDDGEDVDVVKVVDFGIAALVSNDANAMRLTARGLVVGTPEYMSPEQARGEPVDGRADLYAVGALLYELLSGRVPFQGETAAATLLDQMIKPLTPPSHHRKGVDRSLEQICLRALAKDREQRFANAREMRVALRAALTAPPPPPRRRSWRLPAAASFALLSLAAIVATTIRPAQQVKAVVENVAEATAVSDQQIEAPIPVVAKAAPAPAIKPPPPKLLKKPVLAASAHASPPQRVIDDGF
jgi:eukaryotic-like serine/threonine-protein kinase